MEFISLPPRAAVALEALSAEHRLVASGFFDGIFNRAALLEQIAQDRSEVWREVFQPGYPQNEE